MYMSNEYTVEKGDIIQNLNLAGTTQFANSQKLGFVTEGKVTAVYVKVGDQVRKDEVLAVISAESLDREINNMRKNINKSKEDYEKMIRENNENRVFDIKQAEIAQQTAITELAALPARQKIEVENIEQNIKEKKENYDKKYAKWIGDADNPKTQIEKEKEDRIREKGHLELIRKLRNDADKLDNLLDDYDQLFHISDKYEGEANPYIGAKNHAKLKESKTNYRALVNDLALLRESYAKLSLQDALTIEEDEILNAYLIYPTIWEHLQDWARANRIMFLDSVENSSDDPETSIDMQKINGRVDKYSTQILADYTRADALANARDTLRDLDDEIPTGSTKEEELAKLKRELDQAMLDYQAKLLAHQAEIVKAEKAILDAKYNLEEVEKEGGKKAQLDNLKTAIEDQELALENLIDRYEDYQILSNFDGLVTKVNMQIGDAIKSSNNADDAKYISVETPNLLQVNLDIDQIDIIKIQIGMPVKVSVDAIPGSMYSGYFSEIDTTPDGNIYKAKVVFQKNDENEKVLGGMNASIGVLINELRNILLIPNTAIADSEMGEKIVRLKKGTEWIDQVVETGMSDDFFVEVLSGLKEGDTIKELYINEESLDFAGLNQNGNEFDFKPNPRAVKESMDM